MNEEQHASLRILAHVARADGRVCSEELLALDALATGAISTVQMLRDKTDLDTLLGAVVSPELRRYTMVGAVALASVDGHCPLDELAVLEKIHHAFGADAWIDLAGESATWKRRTGRIRRALEGATVAYLHQVHDATTRGKLSMERYARFVAELAEATRKIQGAFREAVDDAIEHVAHAAGCRGARSSPSEGPR
jgi:hypothetical protein